LSFALTTMISKLTMVDEGEDKFNSEDCAASFTV